MVTLGNGSRHVYFFVKSRLSHKIQIADFFRNG